MTKSFDVLVNRVDTQNTIEKLFSMQVVKACDCKESEGARKKKLKVVEFEREFIFFKVFIANARLWSRIGSRQ